jgi:hypothetical protein
LLILDLFLKVSELSEFIDNDGCNNVGEQYVEKGPMNGISDESSVMALLALSRWCLSDDPLSEKGVNAPIYGCAVGLDVTDIHIH